MLGAARLFELRKERGLSQTDLAERLGVTQKRISAIERAEDRNLSTLERYVAALGGRLHAGIEFDDETVTLTPAESPRRKGRRKKVAA
jgi:transcriptional regulator with XRE-family HTH domain